MIKPKFIFLIAAFFLVGLLSPAISFAQTDNRQQFQPSYEIVLQILIASNTGKNTMPQTLSNVVRRLKTNYTFADYRLAQTYVERTSFSVENKGFLNELNQTSVAPVYSDWKLNGLKSLPDSKNSVQFEYFSFDLRIPIVVLGSKGETSLSYQTSGLSIMKFTLSENVPTIIGSLSTSKPDELMFLVLTVKPTED